MDMHASQEASSAFTSDFTEQYAYPQDRGKQNPTLLSGAAAVIISPSSMPALMQFSRRTTPEKLEEENRCLQQRSCQPRDCEQVIPPADLGAQSGNIAWCVRRRASDPNSHAVAALCVRRGVVGVN